MFLPTQPTGDTTKVCSAITGKGSRTIHTGSSIVTGIICGTVIHICTIRSSISRWAFTSVTICLIDASPSILTRTSKAVVHICAVSCCVTRWAFTSVTICFIDAGSTVLTWTRSTVVNICAIR